MRFRLLLFCVLLSCYSIAQNGKRTITGVVTSMDEAAPVENAGVWVKGTSISSGTQADGVYYINISSADSILIFAAEGFEQQEIKIKAASEYNVQLRRKASIVFSCQTLRCESLNAKLISSATVVYSTY